MEKIFHLRRFVMNYTGILVVMGWLGVAGMPGVAGAYDGQSVPLGHVQQISVIRGPGGSYAGNIEKDGTIRGEGGSYLGSIERDGTDGDAPLSDADRKAGALILLHRLPH
ncbi:MULTISPECIES: hypothetical protein [Bombella]|uniref:Uncharacterized protein n=1 Tax=Bombella pollinis TaxID=2967337 RepID=A0ABT3WKE8_9PROT|nr:MULTISPECIES: hypothetical protein [Bombella]MCX5619456.1 hypothetical protein [Bombella pollinis]MUG04928.1 hypothetical protein [Bombella sp. ESL0378]